MNNNIERMSRPCKNGGIWGDAFIMKFITFCLDRALHVSDMWHVLEDKTYCATWSYLQNIDLNKRSISIAYVDDHYHTMTPLSQSSESS
jgi:hypothetical protein